MPIVYVPQPDRATINIWKKYGIGRSYNFDANQYAAQLGLIALEVPEYSYPEGYSKTFPDQSELIPLASIFEEMYGIPKKILDDYTLGFIDHYHFLALVELRRETMAKIPLINFNSTEKRKVIIEFYCEAFDEIPSMAHIVRAYAQIERVVEDMVKESKLVLSPEVEKLLGKFDKMKQLALNNANLGERKVAFFKSVECFEKITGIKLDYERKM